MIPELTSSGPALWVSPGILSSVPRGEVDPGGDASGLGW
jgi:hypothetical protein